MEHIKDIILRLKMNATEYDEVFVIEEWNSLPVIYRLGDWVSKLLFVGLIVTCTFGLLGKYAVLSSILQTGLRRGSPINILIFTDQAVNLVHRSMTICGSALVLLSHRPLVYLSLIHI